MYTLPKEEVDLLINNPDPKVAAAALKLKQSEEKGEFVPRSRVNDLTQEKTALETKLKEIEDERKKAEEDKLRQSGEIGKLLDAEKASKLALQKQFDEEKKIADAHRAYRQSVVESVKAKLGDKWLPEYDSFSLESLSKIAEANNMKIGVDSSIPQSPLPDNPWSKKSLNLAKQIEIRRTNPELAKKMEMEAERK